MSKLCIYWKNGHCHRYPPNVTGNLPPVGLNCFCGEEKIREEEPQQSSKINWISHSKEIDMAKLSQEEREYRQNLEKQSKDFSQKIDEALNFIRQRTDPQPKRDYLTQSETDALLKALLIQKKVELDTEDAPFLKN